jgi:hypothetical protein
MNWIFDALVDWISVRIGEKMTGKVRPMVFGAALIGSILVVAGLLRLFQL